MKNRLVQIQTEAAEIYLIIMLVIYPLFLTGGYEKLFEDKWKLFLFASGFLVLVGMTAWIPGALNTINKKKWLRLTAVDYCILAYLLSVLLSFAGSHYQKQALWGVESWNMGLITQLLLIGTYFVLSRFYRRNKTIELLMAAAWGIVCVILLLQRFGLDVFWLYKGYPVEIRTDFVTTMGQVTWGSAYLTIGLAVFMGCYMEEKSQKNRWRLLAFLVVGFMTMSVLNCDSAMVAVVGVTAVIFFRALKGKEEMLRFLEILMTACGSVILIGIGERIWAGSLVPIDALYVAVATSPLMPFLLLLIAAVYLLMRKEILRMNRDVRRCRLRQMVFGVLLLTGVAFIVLLFILCSKGIWSDSLLDHYFVINDWWGNSRGMIWRTGGTVFQDFSLWNKLFGSGPDSFSFYAYELMGGELRTFWSNQIVPNVHNEWFGAVLNYGLLGGAAYLGIFLTAGICFLSGQNGKTALQEKADTSGIQNQFAAGLAVTAYLLHNILCYQQILGVPFIIIIIAAASRRREELT